MYFMGEQSMNVLMLLKNKSEVAFVYDTNTLRQGIEKNACPRLFCHSGAF